MEVRLEKGWKNLLFSEFEKPYFNRLAEFVKQEYATQTIYPKGSEIFSAFDACPFEKLKVVIIGQDPYHGPGQAHGLCFSVREGIAPPPSLINIFRELQQDMVGDISNSSDLSRWAQQGVLLLNAVLTVRAHQAGSHAGKGWEVFTDAVIERINHSCSGIVFMLWGGYAKKKGARIDTDRHHILSSGHPSPLSANKGHWFGNRHFSKCNEYLERIGKQGIDWRA
jgi:uracil-DNA glycosylase